MIDILFFPFLVLFWVCDKAFGSLIAYWWVLIIFGAWIYIEHFRDSK